jgi:hypothetical protein
MFIQETDIIERALASRDDVDIINSLTGYQRRLAGMLFKEVWKQFVVFASKYRDMHIVNQSSVIQSFKDAVSYITYTRSWAELVGMWGAPGTPPIDEDLPVPVNPMTTPVMSNLRELSFYYPSGKIPDYSRPTVFVKHSIDLETVPSLSLLDQSKETGLPLSIISSRAVDSTVTGSKNTDSSDVEDTPLITHVRRSFRSSTDINSMETPTITSTDNTLIVNEKSEIKPVSPKVRPKSNSLRTLHAKRTVSLSSAFGPKPSDYFIQDITSTTYDTTYGDGAVSWASMNLEDLTNHTLTKENEHVFMMIQSFAGLIGLGIGILLTNLLYKR